jgi:hypothetical protein
VWSGKYPLSAIPEVGREEAQRMAQFGLGAAPFLKTPGLPTFPAWHGTGAKFGEFSDEFMGSGEGAQAFGWGHYVAQRKGVAEAYKPETDNIPKYGDLSLRGQPNLPDISPEAEYHVYGALMDNLASARHIETGDTIGWVRAAGQRLEDLATRYEREGEPFESIEPIDEARSWIADNWRDLQIERSEGHILHVNVKPEEHEFLDYDTPMTQWEPSVEKKYVNLMGEIMRVDPSRLVFPRDPTGGEAYRSLQNLLGPTQLVPDRLKGLFRAEASNAEKASKALHDAGIPGLKFLDQRSRAGLTEPTRNFVVFDPSNIEIMSRDGQRLVPVDYDPWGETGR